VPSVDAQPSSAPERCDLAIVGGGIVGLAVARELLRRNPQASVCVLERESEIGAHQTGHNSGVIHAGVYYVPGSLKARLCVEGAREIYEYCEQRGIAIERCGKVIVATDSSELARLDELERRGNANGVPGLRRIDADGIRELEPHARGIAGLHSPNTGIADFPAVARAYAQDIREAGGTVTTGCEIRGVELRGRSLRLSHSQGATEAGHAVFCAGA
jgi:(S)-2-hydroxyglutarate dehydrogenase